MQIRHTKWAFPLALSKQDRGYACMLCHCTRTWAEIGLLFHHQQSGLPVSNKYIDFGLLELKTCKLLLKELHACKAAKIAFTCTICGAKVGMQASMNAVAPGWNFQGVANEWILTRWMSIAAAEYLCPRLRASKGCFNVLIYPSYWILCIYSGTDTPRSHCRTQTWTTH